MKNDNLEFKILFFNCHFDFLFLDFKLMISLQRLRYINAVYRLLDQRTPTQCRQTRLVRRLLHAVEDADGYFAVSPGSGLKRFLVITSRVSALFKFVDFLLVPGQRVHLIEGGTELQNVDEGKTFVENGLLDEFGEVRNFRGKPLGHEGGAVQKRGGHGVERLVWITTRRRLGLHARSRRRRGLACRQAVEVVVVDEVGQVNVAADGVDEVADALAVGVAVSRVSDDGQLVVSQLDADSHGQSPAVNAVKGVEVVKIRTVGRAADAKNHGHLVRLEAELRQRRFGGRKDAEIAAARAPRRFV